MPQPARRKLSLLDATMLVMGAILGVGIFFNPGEVASLVPHPAAFLGTWGIGGLIALTGAFTFAELGATFPHAGGWFVYLREMYGRPIAFLLAWVVLFVISTGALAVMCGFGASMLAVAFPSIGEAGGAAQRAVSVAMILAMTIVALGGAKVGATAQNVVMLIKVLVVLVLITAGLLFFSPDGSSAPLAAAPQPDGRPLWQGMTVAMLPILFSCGGWTLVGYLSSEIDDAPRNLPRAIIIGVTAVMILYFLLNTTYIRVVGLEYMAANPFTFAGEVAARSYGPGGAKALSVAMAISALGVCAVTIITTPWLYVAMAREGLFFDSFAKLHARTGAPTFGLLLQAAIAILYVFIAGTNFLVNSVVFAEWIFHVLAAFGLLALRAKRPDLPRPFRSFAYPLMPLVYGIFAIGVVAGNLWQSEAKMTMTGLGVLAVGAVVYPLWRRFISARGVPSGT